ncbi:hypothetical protein HanHA300_Chr05g0180121 [Helianthus annuus]|nr:hypothetical protein HanHA300_Chr05g0180121 [Helianthus annuus]KAJ0584964.1 hypothetical protein HanHA89_Chr05g0194821 [Helianthus annuus]KAJ0750631.1 hypothetical protein HanLR1_Chr05g0184191 [Helianthus annuus]
MCFGSNIEGNDFKEHPYHSRILRSLERYLSLLGKCTLLILTNFSFVIFVKHVGSMKRSFSSPLYGSWLMTSTVCAP